MNANQTLTDAPLRTMSNRRSRGPGWGRAALAILPASFIGACTVAPKFEQPKLVATIAERPSYVSKAGQPPEPAAHVAHWWTTMGGEELSTLVTGLDADNLDLSAARRRLDQARSLTRQARASRLPSISLSVDGGQIRTPTPSGDAVWDETYSLSGAASWDLDVFGGLRNAERAARLDAQASALSAEALFHLLTAELTRAYINAWTLARRIEISEQSAASFAETASITEGRYRAGSAQTSALDVQIARQNQASAEAAIPELKALLTVQQHAIDILLARPPGQTQLAFTTPPEAVGLPALSAGAPADLLRRRPDVAAAELAYRAALADVGTARAQRLPSLSLSGTISRQTADASDLFDPEALISNLTAGLFAPLFQGGRLKAQLSLTQAAAEELAANYALSALEAAIDVENALVLEDAYDEQLALRQASLTAAELSDRIARDRYASGQTTILTVLETQRALNTARQDLVIAEQTRLDARIDLHLALGGDWREASLEQRIDSQ